MSKSTALDILTLRQNILTFCKENKYLYGQFPTQKKLSLHFVRSQTTIRFHLNILIEEGYIERYDKGHGACRVVNCDYGTLSDFK